MGALVIRFLACLSLFFFLVPVTYIHGSAPQKNDSQLIQLTPILFHAEQEETTRAGRLEFLRGWKMRSDNADFGGLSAMLALPDRQFLFLSDGGVLVGFTLDEKANQAQRPFIAPLPDGPPVPNEFAKKNWDSESLVYNPDTGQYWVGYERYHGVWRYGRSFARKETKHKVEAMQDWPGNGGAEAMLRLAGADEATDRFLVFSESAPFGKRGYEALIFDGDPTDHRIEPKLFGYRPPRGYRLTDAALLPDGKALLLHRRFTPLDGVSAIISIGDPADIAPGKVWTSRLIARIKPPMRVDNMEALAVTVEGKDTIIWLASDDNFNTFQETILMKFKLLPGKTKRKKASDGAPETGPETEKAEARPGFSTISN